MGPRLENKAEGGSNAPRRAGRVAWLLPWREVSALRDIAAGSDFHGGDSNLRAAAEERNLSDSSDTRRCHKTLVKPFVFVALNGAFLFNRKVSEVDN